MINENNIGGRLERIPVCSVQWKLWFYHEICWILGSVGLGTITFTLTSIAVDFGMNSITKGLVATVTYIGMFIGATVAGVLGDKYGRKNALIVAVILWALSSLMIGITDNYKLFWIFRFLLGLGMGAHFPQSQSMIAELFPAKYRGRALCLVEGGYPLACILAGIMGWLMQISMSWQSVFILQGLYGLCIFIVIFLIPESARYYEMKGDYENAKKIVNALEKKVVAKTGKILLEIPDPVVEVVDKNGKSKFAQLFETSEQTKKTLTMWLLWFCVLFGHYGLNTWLSDLLVGKGFDVVKSNSFVLLMYLPGIPGYLIATGLVEKVGRKKMIFSYMIFAAFFSYFYGTSTTIMTAITFGCLLQVFSFGIWSLIYTYASEVFPTRIRSTGCGTTSSAGRLAALIAPTLFGMIIQRGFPQAYIFIIASMVFVIGAISTMVFGTETKGRSIEDINK